MDVILIQPRSMIGNKPAHRVPLPLGLLSVATPLDLAGYKVRIIDQRIEPDWERSLLAELETKPICVGVTSMGGSQIWWGLKASKLVKEKSDVSVVWGGVHPSFLPQQTLENPYIDIVVQGEGEETFFDLVTALAKGDSLDKVNGIWYKTSNHIKRTPQRSFIDLNQQPPLSYHLIDLKSHVVGLSGRDALLFETSRGCALNCAFCYTSTFHRKHWRSLTAEETLIRIRRIIDKYNVKGFVFSDDNFFGSIDRVHQILEGIVRQRLDIVWGRRYIRLDYLSLLDDDFLHLMERSGCLSLVIGVESGSQKIADMLKKEIDVSQAIPENRRLAKYEMLLRYLFLIGIPGESEIDLYKTSSLILKLMDENQKAAAVANIFVPYPGNELFDFCIQCGFQEPRKLEEWIPVSFDNPSLDYPWLSQERKKLLQMLSFCTYFLAKDNLARFSEGSSLLTLVAKLYHPIAQRRLQKHYYRFMPEQKVAGILGLGNFSLGL